jgi:hypothetical protein
LASAGSLGYRGQAPWEPSCFGLRIGSQGCATGMGGLQRGLSREGLAGVAHVRGWRPRCSDGRG